MAANDEIVKLILELGGQQGVQTLTNDVTRLETEIKKLVVDWQSGAIATDEFMKHSAGLDRQLEQTRGVLDQLKGTGSPGGGGRGVLGASYAIQDFTSQIQNGFMPALASIQNNIPQILMSFGVGAGFTGVISAAAVALGLLIPLIKSAFGGETKEAIEATKKKLEEFEAAIKKVHDAYLNMLNKPTSAEEESAENIKAILDRPTAAMMAKAVGAGASQKSVMAEMGPEEQADIGKGKEVAEMTDEDIAREATKVYPALQAGRRAQLQSDRARAQQKRFEIEQAARQRIGERAVTDATKAGPEGSAARAKLVGVAPADVKRDLLAASPEAIRQGDEQDEAWEDEQEQWRAVKKRRNLKAAKTNTRFRAQASARERVEARIKSDTERKDREAEAQSRSGVQRRADVRQAEGHAMHGQMSDTKRVTEIAKEMGQLRKAQAESENRLAHGMGTMLDTQDVMTERMAKFQSLMRQAKELNNINRTASTNGLAN